ncbi:MAG TPA: hypothetical protein VIM11_25115, partial [Tepidisphaeraceae bacterium]
MSINVPQSTAAGSRRFWVTILCFAVANVGVWIAYARYSHGPRNLLEVQHVTPGDATSVRGRPTFTWAFNLDVAPTPDDVAPGVVAPKLAGHWKWGNPRTLTFTPESPLPKASAFKLTLLPERLHSPDGLGLAKAFVSTVTTQRLEVLSVHQAELDKRDRVVVEIEFSDEVIPAEVLAHLT